MFAIITKPINFFGFFNRQHKKPPNNEILDTKWHVTTLKYLSNSKTNNNNNTNSNSNSNFDLTVVQKQSLNELFLRNCSILLYVLRSEGTSELELTTIWVTRKMTHTFFTVVTWWILYFFFKETYCERDKNFNVLYAIDVSTRILTKMSWTS